MTVHAVSRVIVAPRDRVFGLVEDVERYPQFLPLWRYARVYQRNGDTYFTEQELGIGQVNERFRTQTHLVRPLYIEVTSDDDLFREFFIRWDFDTVGSGCRVAVALTWEMKSRALQATIDRLLSRAARSMVTAFEGRAQEQFGAPIGEPPTTSYT